MPTRRKNIKSTGRQGKGLPKSKAMARPISAAAATTRVRHKVAKDHSDAHALADRKRRKRRTREDVVGRICQAARQLFADRGYAGTTTKEIALTADVSETLLFRYYGNKADLFDEVISSPINSMMTEFVALHSDEPVAENREAVVRKFVAKLFEIFDQNEELFRAAVATPRQPGENSRTHFYGLEKYFEESAIRLEMDYDIAANKPGFDPRIAVRLAFGMIASAVLLRDWLFPQGVPSQSSVTKVLEHMIMRALGPRRGR
jgi:AcrR family transcriptional regulator